ncbi:MAG: hypothetical protein KF763_08195 [Cyclobacteriaceae bacterium]|nr:hypothetical protein [Cyclobacteriaceae bacterium]
MKYTHWIYLIVILTCSGCYRYQYASLSSDLNKGKSQQFVFETETMRIEYAFIGMNCPVQIKIVNKSISPLYVDWGKSALILDDRAFPYWKNEAVINAAIDGYEIAWSNLVSTSGGELIGSIYRNEKISFIPPNSSIVVEPFSVRHSLFSLPAATKQQKTKHTTGVRIAKHVFPKEATPLQFRSYITYAFSEDFHEPKTIDNQFWVSEIIQTFVSPQELPSKSADQFYVSEFTGFAQFAIALIGLVLIVGYVLTD